ncbi:MAG TPA: tRNA (adenosine(37)-N6)-threonylcarbamoyltransferase complex dimerization subunit type 1 TsaB [Pirellulales bacterium]|nr:tRNA (adenosine(37)-N6)-threonylcarbamoyltransferase complex dimerization subunit type 1 TsaB [Pirellulales bacterium]
MRILALETSGTTGSVAAFDDSRALSQAALDPALRSARTLAPAIAELLKQVAWKPRDVQMVAVGVGPGSFTGLRLGVMTAKAFAYAVGAQVLAISTLEAIARNSADGAGRVAVAIDAQRGEVYCGRYHFLAGGEVEREAEIAIISVDDWLASLNQETLASGPALVKLAERVNAAAHLAPRDKWLPDAAAIGRLAAQRAARGESDDLWSLAPCYLRRSAAEEKWETRAT